MNKNSGVSLAESEGDRVPLHCSTCGNENPYIIGQVRGGENCPECLESESYMDSLID